MCFISFVSFDCTIRQRRTINAGKNDGSCGALAVDHYNVFLLKKKRFSQQVSNSTYPDAIDCNCSQVSSPFNG